MINLKTTIKTSYATKQSDAEKVFKIWENNNFKDLILDLEGTQIVATAFFNKIFFLFNEKKWNTDKILEKIKIKNAKDIHMFAFQSAVDISYNKEEISV